MNNASENPPENTGQAAPDASVPPPWKLHLRELEALRATAAALLASGAAAAGASLEQKFAVGDFRLALEDLEERAQRQLLQSVLPVTPEDAQINAGCKNLVQEFLAGPPAVVSRDTLRTYRNMAEIWPPGDSLRNGRLPYSHLRLLSQQRNPNVRAALTDRLLLEPMSANRLQQLISVGAGEARGPDARGAKTRSPGLVCAYTGRLITDLTAMAELRLSPAALKPGASVPILEGNPRGAASVRGGQGEKSRLLRFIDVHALQGWLTDNAISFRDALPARPPGA